MKLLYDSQCFDMQTHGGVSRCFVELHKNMPSIVQSKIGVLETDNVYLQDLGFKHKGQIYQSFIKNGEFPCKGRLFDWYYNKFLGYDYWKEFNRKYDIRLLKKGNFDVFHPTYYNPYFLEYIGKKPFVITVHDMIPELYPQYFRRNDFQIENKKVLLPKASHIIAVSEQTKQDIVRLLDIPESKISVVYHGSMEKEYIPSKISPIATPYILYVGGRNGYKNFNLWIKEASCVLKNHPEIRVVCTGNPFNSEELALFKTLGIEDRVVNCFVKSDQELFDLYHYAVVFVYPSDYEGFGIPILEAYKADCIVMLNDASCFPEVAGDAAFYFSFNGKAPCFSIQFEKVYQMNAVERDVYLKKQRERLALYSWKKSALQLSKIYESVL